MKRIYGLVSALLLCAGSYAQTVTMTSDTLSITTAGGQGIITFNPAAQNAITAGVLTVYTKGDFGSTTEYVDVIDEGATNLGQATSSNDCETVYDATVFNVTMADINVWNANGTITFTMDASANVNICTPFASVYATLTYDTCAGGTPVAVNYTATNYTMCMDPDTAVLTPNITGGTFSGPGMTGNVFYPAAAGPGSHTVVYTYFDASVGCNSTYDTVFTVTNDLVVMDTAICMDGTATLTSPDGDSLYIWYDSNLNPIDTAASITVGPLNATTNYYLAKAATEFSIDTIYTTGGTPVDHNTQTGDDRGGIAVTQQYVYINGDNNVVRYDTNMTNPVTYTRNDGLFSDLATGTLYALSNSTMGYPQGISVSNFVIDEIVELDAATAQVSTIALSQSITVSGSTNTSQAGVYAGYGYVIVYTGTSGTEFFRIDLPSGTVTSLGTFNFTTKRASENWSHWGFSEFVGGDYTVVHRTSAGQDIARLNLNTQATTVLQTFTNLSDMASITYHPWTGRIYYHNESTNQWGGGAETGGYIDAGHISGDIVVSGTCRAEATVSVSICAGVDEAAAGLGVNVFPNPSKGMFTVQLEENTNVNAIVTDVFGKVVYNESLINATQHTVDLTHLSKGMYFLQLVDGAKNVTKRLVIQ